MANSQGDKQKVRAILDAVKKEGRDSLTAPEGKLICDAYGINVPKEGVVGWLDSEMKMKTSHADRFNQFINAWGQAEFIPPLFKEFREAWFNEKAYKLLVNQGQGDFADALLYNQPEQALKANLKGPQKDPNAYITAFNSVFGA